MAREVAAMTKLESLIAELCPGGVEYVVLGDCLVRTKGTKITAEQMQQLNKENAPVKIFAGGKTVAYFDYDDIPESDIQENPSVIVKSRGFIEFEYYDKPFSHKNEFWAYHSQDNDIDIKYVYYCLKKEEPYFRNLATSMGSLPQISIPVTDKYKIPLPPLPVQREIVRILDNFTDLTADLTAELTAELTARKKQYEYYRDSLLVLPNAPRVTLGDVIISLKTGLNPRKNFILNTENAQNYYVTVREIVDGKIVFFDKTDRVDNEALTLINNRSNLEERDVLFSGTGTVGKIAVVEEKPINWNIKEGVYAIKPRQEFIMSRFLAYVLSASSTIETYRTKIVGSPVCSLPMADFRKLSIPLPPLPVQCEIIRILDDFTELTAKLTAELTAELTARKEQYEWYRDKLLRFEEVDA